MFGRISPLLLVATGAIVSSCLLESDLKGSDGPVSSQVILNLTLDPNQRELAKASAADTSFSLDSLIVVLSAAGEAPQTYRYPISGRPDTGAITLARLQYAGLAALKNWKAVFYTIDTTANPVHRDTVHIDSSVFAVLPSDTVLVNKTVSAAYSILRARFLSNLSDSIGSGVRYLRLRVAGTTRDSVDFTAGTGDANNAVAYASHSTAWVVRDGGKAYKSTDSGKTWYAQTTGVGANLNAVWFLSATEGWAAGDSGRILKSNGTTWSVQASGTSHRLKSVMFTSSTTGYAAGDSGVVMRTLDGGDNWHPVSGGWFPQTSGTSSDLHATHFASTTSGWAVGAQGKILGTTNSGATWNTLTSNTGADLQGVSFGNASRGVAVGDSETIVRTTDGTAWINVTATAAGWVSVPTSVSEDFKAIDFFRRDSGWAVGAAGRIARTTDRGTTWSSLTSGANDLNGVYAVNNLVVYAVGSGTSGGTNANMRRTTDGGVSWSVLTSGVSTELRGIWSNATGDRLYVVGASGVMRRSTNGTSWSDVSPVASGTFNAVHGNATGTARVWAVGDGGAVYKRNNTNNGDLSAITTTGAGTTNLSDVFAWDNNIVWIVGDNGFIQKTTDNGSTWSTQTATPSTTANLRSVWFSSSTEGYITGDGGLILRTTDGGATWHTLRSRTGQNLTGVYARSSDTAYAVGPAGLFTRTFNGGLGWSGKYGVQNLYRASFHSVSTGFAVGDSGIVLRSTDTAQTWSALTSGTSQRLRGVHANGSRVWAVGDNGAYIRSANPTGSPPTWTAPTSPAAGVQLNSVWFTANSVGYVVGNGGLIRKTSVDNNATWVTQGAGVTTENLVQVVFSTTDTSRGYIVGESGTILATTNGGATWSVQASGTNQALRGLAIANGDSVFAVGAGGTILKTRSGGARLTGTANLNSIHFNGATGYAVGNGGATYRSTNSGLSWSSVSGASTNLNGVFVYNGSNAYAVGDAGTIKYVSSHAAASWSTTTPVTTRNLRAVGVYGAPRVYIAGDSGTILTANSGLPNGTYSVRASGTSANLYGLNGVNPTMDTVLFVGDRESVVKTYDGAAASFSLLDAGSRLFDRLLTYKYLKPGLSNTVVIQAIDRTSPLRGYEKSFSLLVGAGRDSTINYGLTRCGYGGSTPSCTP